MNDWRVPGFTSTGSKRPDALFGTDGGGPTRMTRAAGCRVWDEGGREYVDFIMALGAVALGYGHPDVNRAATAAIGAGVVGPLPPVAEEELAIADQRDHDLAVRRAVAGDVAGEGMDVFHSLDLPRLCCDSAYSRAANRPVS